LSVDIFETGATVALLVLSISVHEWAHAVMTTALGDETARSRGRLTLNPLSHADPVWTLIIPFLALQFGGMFVAAGRPVPYDPNQWNGRLRGRRVSRKWGEFLVAFAGPGSNLLQAFGAALILGLVLASGQLPLAELSSATGSLQSNNAAASVVWALDQFIFINCLLAVFNLLPVAPLDGEKVIAVFLPDALAARLANLGSWGFLIVLFIVFRLPDLINTPILALRSACYGLALLIAG
jgi:Zn-dependent protease